MRFCATMRSPAFSISGVDRAGQIARGRVGLDDRKGAFNRHDFVLAKR
jgi:hypothetical protein